MNKKTLTLISFFANSDASKKAQKIVVKLIKCYRTNVYKV
jgi:hypothetical protein